MKRVEYSTMSGVTVPLEKQNKRKMQAEATKARIFKSAQDLIRQHGYDGTSVEMICRRARVSKGAFYHHFSSKSGLIVEGYSICDRYFDDHVAGKLEATTTEEKLVEFIRYQLEYAVETGVDLIKQLYKSQIDHGTAFFISDERSLPTILRGLVKDGQNRGELKEGYSADYISHFLLRFSRGLIYDWCLHEGAYDLVNEGVEASRRVAGIFCRTSSPA